MSKSSMINLYDHQKRALEQTADMNRVAYYLDMGLGKTFVGSEKMHQLGAKENLVICQKSKVGDWVDHFCKYYSEEQFEFVIDGTQKASLDFFIRGKYQSAVCVINYELAFRRPELKKLSGFTLMLDESSLIQNETAKRSKFILKLDAKNVILLSGTPTAGKYEKLWSQIHLLGWSISKDLYWQQYVETEIIDDEGYPIKIVKGYKNVERLKKKLRQHGAVFMKSNEVFDLPEQVFIDTRVNTMREYRRFKKTCLVTIEDHELVGDTTLTKMLYERMLCGQYCQSKLAAFRSVIESTEDRVIVFYNFDGELQKLREIAEDLDRSISIVNGKTKDLTAYETEENSVTFVQYQAGAMGLNLQKSNKIIYFTPPLSSELYEQSKKRTHRIGQERSCFYYRLICKNSIEGKIYDTLEMRRDYTDKLFEQDS